MVSANGEQHREGSLVTFRNGWKRKMGRRNDYENCPKYILRLLYSYNIMAQLACYKMQLKCCFILYPRSHSQCGVVVSAALGLGNQTQPLPLLNVIIESWNHRT